MKKWLYFIAPAVGLGVFLFFYYAHVEEAGKRLAAKKVEIEKRDAEEAAKKKALEERARQDADRLAAERAKEEAKKLAERVAAQAAEDKKVKDATDLALGECDKYTKEIARMERELSDLRAKKEKTTREFLEISKQLELAKIARRNAELEVQRMTEMVATKAAESAMAKFVPPPAPVAK
ncbi:MAG: hypothetical protein HZA31_09020 [Opitutae bacterium]|nr:hypothetical protein [Opitutae bacterium]